MKRVRFNGYPHAPGKAFATPPLVGIWQPGDVRVFDRALAEEYGRLCGPACTGDCFAQMHVAAGNTNHEKTRRKPFEILHEPAEGTNDHPPKPRRTTKRS